LIDNIDFIDAKLMWDLTGCSDLLRGKFNEIKGLFRGDVHYYSEIGYSLVSRESLWGQRFTAGNNVTS